MKKKKILICIIAAFLVSAFIQKVIPQSLGIGSVQAYAKVKMNKTKIVMVKGQSTQLKISGTAKKVKWKSSRKSVASVSSRGKVTARGKGSATITAQIGSKKYSCKITVYSTKADRAIACAKDNYYGTNNKVHNRTYVDCGIKGIYKEYADKNDNIRLTIMYPGNGDMDVNNYTVEYYYDEHEKLVFAYAYKKVGGVLKDYRAYYGTDGKCYRYIKDGGTVKTYKNGKDPYSCNEMVRLLYSKGSWNIIVANGG